MSESGPGVLVRKLRTSVSLADRLLGRLWGRVSNLLRKRWRHYAKRAVWTGKRVRERGKNARVLVRNLAHVAKNRILGLHKPFIRVARRTRRASQLLALRRGEWSVEREVRRLGSSGRPLILGPWISEVGFEVLYWVPFLTWLRGECRWDPATVVAVSRGGVASWYRGVAHRYVEIFDHIPPAVFAKRNQTRREAAEGIHKQFHLSELDAELVAVGTRESGMDRPVVIHPSFMYRLFRHFWLGHRPISHVQERTRFVRPETAIAVDLGWLPDDYVAVKVYTAQSLPDSPANRQMLRALVAHLARVTNVVVLETGFAVDDHDDYPIDGDRIYRLDTVLTPSNNLEVQTQVISGARAFVGTCGSLTWLAPLLGVPTVALFTDARFLRTHLYFARHVYSAAGAASFATVDLATLTHLRMDGAALLERVAPS